MRVGFDSLINEKFADYQLIVINKVHRQSYDEYTLNTLSILDVQSAKQVQRLQTALK